ncbi:MAG: hypothetical protein QM660_08975 [Dysgonomonas sp.]
MQKIETRIRNFEGVHPTEDEVSLLITGLNSIPEDVVEEFVTISKNEA